MDIKKLYALQKQLGRLLYDPTPEQTAWRDKMWNEGRFDEIEAHTRQAEEQFEYVEKQIEMAEAAEPSVGQKIVTNTLLNLPWGKGAKGTGIGSLLGIAEEEMGAAETQRLKDIEQKIYQLNAIRQRDLEGGRVTSGTIGGVDAEIETLEDEAYELKQLLSTQLSDEPVWYEEENQFEPSPREGAKWEAENFRQKQLDERANRFLGAEEVAQEKAYYNRIEGEPEGIMSMLSKIPLSEEGAGKEIETKTLYHRGPKGIDKFDLRPDRFGENKNALFFLNNPQKEGYGEALYKVEAALPEGSSLKLGNPPKELIENLDAEIAQLTDPIDKEEMIELRGVLQGNKWFGGTSESRQLMRESGQVRSLTSKQSEFLLNQGIKHLESINTRGIPGFLQNTTSIVLDPDILNITGVDGAPTRNLISETPTTGEAGPPSPPSGPPSPPSGGDGNGGPTREDVLKYINTLSLKERLGAYTPYGEGYDEEIFQYEDLFDWDKDVVNWENIPDDYRSEGQELARAFFEKNQISEKFETDLVKNFTYRGKSQPYFEDVDMDKIRVRVPRQGTDYGSGAKYSQKTFTNPTYGELEEWFAGLEKGHLGIEKPRSYRAGGYVMNYGDYGRSYK